ASGLLVDRAVVVDEQLRTSDPHIFAVGECAQYKATTYGVVEPLYEQARVLADVLTGADPRAAYRGSKLATTLKVMGVDLVRLGADADLAPLPHAPTICNCTDVCKGAIVAAIKSGCHSVTALGEKTWAGTGCGTCQPLLSQLIQITTGKARAEPNKIELMKKD